MIQYLILHKVRGEAAFDIAHQIEVEDDKFWIVSTSGHRAYPHMHWRLEDLVDTSDVTASSINHPAPWRYEDQDLSAYPDHYSANDRNVQEKPDITRGFSLLAKLGLLKPEKRRA